MRGATKLTLIAVFVCLLQSCKNSLPPAEYIQYIRTEANGLRRTIAVDQWKYTFQYKPSEYILLFEQRQGADRKQLEQRRNELRNTIWFSITIERADRSVSPLRYELTSKEEYQERLNYFLNSASKDITLCNGKDPLRLAAYHFETNYNLTPQETMIVGFHSPEPLQQDLQISYHDRVFKNGILKTTILKENILRIPKVSIE